MSQVPENKDTNQEDLFDVSNIFSKRMPFVEPDANEQDSKEDVKKAEAPKKVEEETPLEPSKPDEEDDGEKQTAAKENDIDYSRELEKLNKTLKDTQRSFHEDRKKLSAYKKAVEKLKAEGTILDEEATLLLDHTRFENEAGEEVDEPTLIKYSRVWDKEIEYMRKYSTNAEDINQNIRAFHHLIQSSSEKERQEILDELSSYEDDEVELTKQMLEMGRQYNDDIYSDIHKAGNIRNLKSILYKKEEELQKKVDKLQKQYDNLKKKYEDYDEGQPTRISAGGGLNDIPDNADAYFDVEKIFESRNKRR